MNSCMLAAVYFDQDGRSIPTCSSTPGCGPDPKSVHHNVQSGAKSSRKRTVWLAWPTGLGRKSRKSCTLHDSICKQLQAKAHVFADSALCLSENASSSHYQERFGSDSEFRLSSHLS